MERWDMTKRWTGLDEYIRELLTRTRRARRVGAHCKITKELKDSELPIVNRNLRGNHDPRDYLNFLKGRDEFYVIERRLSEYPAYLELKKLREKGTETAGRYRVELSTTVFTRTIDNLTDRLAQKIMKRKMDEEEYNAIVEGTHSEMLKAYEKIHNQESERLRYKFRKVLNQMEEKDRCKLVS